MLKVSVNEELRQNDRLNASKRPSTKARKFKRFAEKQKVEEVDKLALEYVSEVSFHHHLILIGPGVDSTK